MPEMLYVPDHFFAKLYSVVRELFTLQSCYISIFFNTICGAVTAAANHHIVQNQSCKLTKHPPCRLTFNNFSSILLSNKE